MKGNRTGVIKVHCKSSGKSCSGKTNIRTIFFGDTVSLLDRTNVVYLFKCPLGDWLQKKIVRMLVLPLELFPDDLQYYIYI